MLNRISIKAATYAGSNAALLIATAVCAFWVIRDREFDFLDGVSLVTFWLAVVIQSAQTHESARDHQRDEAMHLKLDEILRAIPEADDHLRGIEDSPTRPR